MAKIIAPNKQYTGTSASVGFVNGVGETTNPNLIEWFNGHGYEVIEDEVLADEEEDKEEDKEEILDDSDEKKEDKKKGKKGDK
ncbi:hypothetical protein [Clostridium algidicarnis]|uniref:hypothetical protein n=1 Tax=Clostridium algidicarnis TaxID=37659 RepID=UPI00162557C3|nr:hypothetical protein [Clostridium algidicarnis]MBB6696252.1 hypothetical protein [Clostridium algidicarnis]